MSAALLRFRVVAWVVGVFLILLTIGILLRYTDLFGYRTDVVSRTVSPIHGFGYMVYLATGIDLASRRRWRPLTTLGVLLAGTVPFLSFLAERRVTADVRAETARRDAQGRDTTGRDTTGRDTTGRDTTGRDATGRDTTDRTTTTTAGPGTE